jgi:hypothetical protein
VARVSQDSRPGSIYNSSSSSLASWSNQHQKRGGCSLQGCFRHSAATQEHDTSRLLQLLKVYSPLLFLQSPAGTRFLKRAP